MNAEAMREMTTQNPKSKIQNPKSDADWQVACPRCRRALGSLAECGERLACAECDSCYALCGGIWRFLPPERALQFAPFLRDYTAIRSAEGRGSSDPAYYLGLPQTLPGDPLAWQWRIRARSFTYLAARILPQFGLARRVLDLGAGTCWLSYRLALLGHRPCSIDLTDDARDGLGAARHYGARWPRLQAEFDRLPIDEGEADVVIYNASLHYSTDYSATLSEALRVLRPGGAIVVMDSPLYRRDASGRQMCAERHIAFERAYGTRSDALPSI